MSDLISRQAAIDTMNHMRSEDFDGLIVNRQKVESMLKALPSVQPDTNCSEIPNNSDTISRQAVTKFLNDWLSCLFENCHKQSASDLKMIIKDFKNLPSAQPERKDAVEKAVAVEAICDELMSRFDVSATYGYDFAEAAVNRIEVMAKELEEGEQE